MKWIITIILEFLWSKITPMLAKLYEAKRKKSELEEKTKLELEKMKNAKTPEEIDEAAKSTLNNL